MYMSDRQGVAQVFSNVRPDVSNFVGLESMLKLTYNKNAYFRESIEPCITSPLRK